MPEVVSNIVDRYALGQAIASGGMATLHLGRLVGSAGFARTVAIKRLHSHLCLDPNFVKAFADEARLAARVRHPNVVPTLDVVSTEQSADAPAELLLVMEYIDGESLSSLWRRASQKNPLAIVVAIVSEMLHGLHSAHEAKSEAGEPLGIVHRDVSPQNVLVGADGVARLVDFGIARATGLVGNTNEGEVKGKLAYMAPEQIRREPVTRKADIFAAGIVLWELLAGERLFASDNPGATLEKILVGWVAPPSSIARDVPTAIDEITLRALDADPANRFETARDMAVALEDACQRALGRDVGEWVEKTAGTTLTRRREQVAAAERATHAVAFDPTLPAHPIHRPSPRPEETRTQFVREGRVSTVPGLGPGSLPPPSSHASHAGGKSAGATIESERTVTVFSAGSGVASNSGSGSEGVFAAASTVPPFPPRRRTATSKAIALVALAASLTVFLGNRYAATSAARAESANAVAAATMGGDPVSAVPAMVGRPTPITSPITSTPPMAAGNGSVVGHVLAPSPPPAPFGVMTPSARGTPPVPTTGASAAQPASQTAAQPASAPVRRAPRPRAPAAAPVHAPCVAKLDPATGKTVYKGDCD